MTVLIILLLSSLIMSFIVIALLVHGTYAKNRWGLNFDPVFCPRCNTRAPEPPEPRSFRQARWGEWTCPACGTEVDKWGRELAPPRPGRVGAAALDYRKSLQKKSIAILAACYFCLSLVVYWARGWFPSTALEAVLQVGMAILETAVFTFLYYLVATYVVKRFFSTEKPRGRSQGRGTGED